VCKIWRKNLDVLLRNHIFRDGIFLAAPCIYVLLYLDNLLTSSCVLLYYTFYYTFVKQHCFDESVCHTVTYRMNCASINDVEDKNCIAAWYDQSLDNILNKCVLLSVQFGNKHCFNYRA